MRTLYIGINGETKGPFTTDQIFSMWSSGSIPADALYFNDESQEWEQLLDVVDTFKPATGVKKLLNIQPLTEEQKKAGEASTNKGCGCLSIGSAILLLLVGIGMFQMSFENTTTETKYSKEYVSNPTPVYRDIYKIYSPEEERAFQQKKLDSHFTTTSEKTTRAKTGSEKSSETSTSIFLIIIGVVMLGVGINYYAKAKRNSSI